MLVKQDWELEELIAHWTLIEDDWRLLGNKTGATRLGFALILKYFEIEDQFPGYPEEVPPAAVEFMAELVKVELDLFAKYSLSNRTAEYHRAQIREALGFRPATVADEQRWTACRMFPSDFLDCPEPVRYTLLAALCWVRQAEITDALIGLLVDLVQKINARAEKRVEKELISPCSHRLDPESPLPGWNTAHLQKDDQLIRSGPVVARQPVRLQHRPPGHLVHVSRSREGCGPVPESVATLQGSDETSDQRELHGFQCAAAHRRTSRGFSAARIRPDLPTL